MPGAGSKAVPATTIRVPSTSPQRAKPQSKVAHASPAKAPAAKAEKSAVPPFHPDSGLNVDREKISEIIPGKMFLTGWRGASKKDPLSQLGVTGVVSIGFPAEENPHPDAFKYLNLDLTDDESQADAMLQCFGVAMEFISSQKCVVVHCAAGISRSATVVLAFLVFAQKMSLRQAFEFTIGKRRCIWPNNGFMKVLCVWEVLHHKKKTMDMKEYEVWSEFNMEEYQKARVVDRN